jgi:hypothetical protein
MKQKAPAIQFAKIPNNIIGRLFLWVLRRYMNTDRYSIVTRGRKPRRVIRYSYDVQKSNAQELGLYIVDRWEKKQRENNWSLEGSRI